MPTRFSIMTYNVHSCIGRDGKASPDRIADIIALYEADIICLQEVDSGLQRSGKTDQAREIANRLNMTFHFHPSLRVAEGEYGNAVLSRYPSVSVRASVLPMLPDRTKSEQRGALWVRTRIGKLTVNILTTHLGLSARERKAQAKVLLGGEWLANAECHHPVILCGDLNTVPLLGVYRMFTEVLRDASSTVSWGRGRTWPSRFPFMRLDHVFHSPDILIDQVLVPGTKLTRMASDHLPLIAKVRIIGAML